MKAFLLALITLLLVGFPVYAQEELQIDVLSPTPPPEVTYVLPYPGILPDNPLYSLKATRDRLVSFFIADPVKKAEFDLLQADKRLQAGLFLMHRPKPKYALGISTISKGQNYLEEALTAAESAVKQVDAKTPSPTDLTKIQIGDLPDKLRSATKKHNELLHKEKLDLSGDDAKNFQLLITRSDQHVKRAEAIQKALK